MCSLICKHKSAIKLIEATSQEWQSGVNGGGRGTEYSFKIKILSSKKIEFDSLWINNDVFKISLSNMSKTISNKPISFSKNDTIKVRTSNFSVSTAKPISLTQVTPPKKHNGAAIMRYFVDSSVQYLVIEKITKLKSINQP